MTDWIAWTKCLTCDHTEKDVFQRPDDGPPGDGAPNVACPKCGNPARYITFPAFEIETMDISQPSDAMYDTMDDW
jgi:hypothetical protein